MKNVHQWLYVSTKTRLLEIIKTHCEIIIYFGKLIPLNYSVVFFPMLLKSLLVNCSIF